MSRNAFNTEEREYNRRQEQIETAKRESDEASVPRRMVLYHGDADGFGAAYALWTKYKDRAVYLPVQYGQPVPEIPEEVRYIYIVDFSYDRQTLLDLAKKYHVQVIDHHKTAEAELEGLSFCTFDTTKAGCLLTWEYVYGPDDDPPDLLQYIADRDLWKWELPGSEEINLCISTLPFDFYVWETWAEMDSADFFNTTYGMGGAIKEFRDRQIDSTMKNVRLMVLAGHTVPVVNCTANISEVGHAMNEAYPEALFSVSYADRKDTRTWSLRSQGKFDVSQIAKQFGGGGHKNAAGFQTEIGWLEQRPEEFDRQFEKEQE